MRAITIAYDEYTSLDSEKAVIEAGKMHREGKRKGWRLIAVTNAIY
ncbi:MAG: hypothetical protein JJU37_07490 [Balneolaceae bacterium]|nr:hypothetical protein [Balneolaceae bacterium]